MPKYLVTATAFRRSDEHQGASPRTFSFVVPLDQPWNAKNSPAVGDVAFDECHRAFGFWPAQNPQIDSVALLLCEGFPNASWADVLHALNQMNSKGPLTEDDFIGFDPAEPDDDDLI